MNDNIAAISSGLTESGIGIVRISGPDSYAIADKIFRSKNGEHVDLSEPNRVHYGFIVPIVSRETLDEVLLINMKAPHTFTGEDTIEIDCHGGILMMKNILEAVIEAGARPAEPGEFTKRAFLNGRIDLSQSEAVIDLINAKNDNAIRASMKQLKGHVSKKISELRAGIIHDTAFIEAALDDPEHYSLDGFAETLHAHTESVLGEIEKLIESYRYGKLVKEGINTVILGKPNAGKSSLLNAILGEERAIVTQIPGTTRDTIRESVSIGSVTLNISDTAGIRETEDLVESIGVQRALENAKEADLILCVIDMSRELEDSDREILKHIRENRAKVLFLFNKTDIAAKIRREDVLNEMPEDRRDYIMISAKQETGIDELCRYIENLFSVGEVSYNDQITISSVRHVSLLKEAKTSLEGVLMSLDAGMPEDFYTIDLMNAYKVLGQISGEDVGEDLVNEIFSKFCMGK